MQVTRRRGQEGRMVGGTVWVVLDVESRRGERGDVWREKVWVEGGMGGRSGSEKGAVVRCVALTALARNRCAAAFCTLPRRLECAVEELLVAIEPLPTRVLEPGSLGELLRLPSAGTFREVLVHEARRRRRRHAVHGFELNPHSLVADWGGNVCE